MACYAILMPQCVMAPDAVLGMYFCSTCTAAEIRECVCLAMSLTAFGKGTIVAFELLRNKFKQQ